MREERSYDKNVRHCPKVKFLGSLLEILAPGAIPVCNWFHLKSIAASS